MTGLDHTNTNSRKATFVRFLTDSAVLAAGLALALPLILPFG